MKPAFGVFASRTYLDNAATTEIDPDVFDEMTPFMEHAYGNSDTLYSLGLEAKEAVETAAGRIAEMLGCSPENVFFTSGGTEANNWAINSVGMLTYGGRYGKVVFTGVEHSSVIRPALRLIDFGAEIGTVGVGKDGLVKEDEYREAVKDAKLVCVQLANNEIGTVQDIKTLAKIAHEAGALVHVDAVQAFGKIPVFPFDLDIDMMSISAHKIHGPKGVGALYIRSGLKLEPFIYGGAPDTARGGTVPVHQIVGFGAATEKARCTISAEHARQSEILWKLTVEMREKSGGIRNGCESSCVPNILSVRFPAVEGTVLAGVLNQHFGICVSTGAACSKGAPSHVLKAIGLNASEVASTIRISIGRMTTEKHIDLLNACIQPAIRMAKEKSTK